MSSFVFSSFLTLLLFSTFLSGCTKRINDVAATKPAADVKDNSEYIITPEGPMLKSNVHTIEYGHHLEFRNGHAYKVHTGSGRVVEDLGSTKPSPGWQSPLLQNRSTAGKTTGGKATISAPSFGYITYAQWLNTTNQPINNLSTTWTVPDQPTANNNQLVYIWNGLQPQDGSLVIQPVLQWGSNNVFGGQYWTITNWCAWGSHGAYMPPQAPISPGAVLQGVLTYTGNQGDGSFNYTSAFSGYPSLTMNITEGFSYSDEENHGNAVTIPAIQPLNWAFEALEAPAAHQVVQVADYPSQWGVAMRNISVSTGAPGQNNPVANLLWGTLSPGATLGENTVDVSDNTAGAGQVNIVFSNPALGARIGGATSVSFGIGGNTYVADMITAVPGTTVTVSVTAGGKFPIVSTQNFTINTPGVVLSNGATNINVTSGTKSASFVMPATGYISYYGNYSHTGNTAQPNGYGSISVQ